MPLLRNIGGWFEARLNLAETLGPLLRHPVPRGLVGKGGWFYVFGSASMTLFIIQILTGICLALVYVPSADDAYASLEYLNYDVFLGWFLRALHNTAASAMVIMVLVHMIKVANQPGIHEGCIARGFDSFAPCCLSSMMEDKTWLNRHALPLNKTAIPTLQGKEVTVQSSARR